MIHNDRFIFSLSRLNIVQETKKKSRIVNLFGLKIKLQHKHMFYEINLPFVASCLVTVFNITFH